MSLQGVRKLVRGFCPEIFLTLYYLERNRGTCMQFVWCSQHWLSRILFAPKLMSCSTQLRTTKSKIIGLCVQTGRFQIYSVERFIESKVFM